MTVYRVIIPAASVFHTTIYSSSQFFLFHLGQPPLRGALSLSITFMSCEKQASEVLQGEKAGF